MLLNFINQINLDAIVCWKKDEKTFPEVTKWMGKDMVDGK